MNFLHLGNSFSLNLLHQHLPHLWAPRTLSATHSGMKTLLKCLVLGVTGLILVAPPRASADLEISASVHISAEADFYEPLTPHGAWIEVDSHRCWRPSGVAVSWRPYTTGEWVWTDYGWYWVSDEPWAWATYHYGRWTYHPQHHWIWVPGREWAPAWVSWRHGGGHIGWAPLAPTISFRHRHSIGGPDFVFVRTASFHQPVRPNTVIVNNTTIINNTTVIAQSPTRETRTVDGSQKQVYVNKGPQPQEVEKETGRKTEPVPIQQVAARTAVPEAVKAKAAAAPAKADQNNTKSKDAPNAGKNAPPTKTEPTKSDPDSKAEPARPQEPRTLPDKKGPGSVPVPAPTKTPENDPDKNGPNRKGPAPEKPNTPDRSEPKDPKPPVKPLPPTPEVPKPVPPPETPKPPGPEKPKPIPPSEVPKPRPAKERPFAPPVVDELPKPKPTPETPRPRPFPNEPAPNKPKPPQAAPVKPAPEVQKPAAPPKVNPQPKAPSQPKPQKPPKDEDNKGKGRP